MTHPLTVKRRRSDGLCAHCGAPSPEKFRCPECTKKASTYVKNRTESDPSFAERRRQLQGKSARKSRDHLRLHPVTPPTEKRCGNCGIVKPSGDFTRQKLSRDGLYGYCKDCSRAKSREANSRRFEETWIKNAVYFARARAKKYGYTFELTEDDVLDIFRAQEGLCYWFGVPLVPSAVALHPQKPSLDKIDSDAGYTRDNTVLACVAANLGRSSCDPEVFREFCDLLKRSK
jgi:hypothetical protein